MGELVAELQEWVIENGPAGERHVSEADGVLHVHLERSHRYCWRAGRLEVTRTRSTRALLLQEGPVPVCASCAADLRRETSADLETLAQSTRAAEEYTNDLEKVLEEGEASITIGWWIVLDVERSLQRVESTRWEATLEPYAKRWAERVREPVQAARTALEAESRSLLTRAGAACQLGAVEDGEAVFLPEPGEHGWVLAPLRAMSETRAVVRGQDVHVVSTADARALERLGFVSCGPVRGGDDRHWEVVETLLLDRGHLSAHDHTKPSTTESAEGREHLRADLLEACEMARGLLARSG